MGGNEQFVAINMGNWTKLLQIERVYIGLRGNHSRLFLLNPILIFSLLAEHIKKTYTTSQPNSQKFSWFKCSLMCEQKSYLDYQ